jgi:hypothetical protein
MNPMPPSFGSTTDHSAFAVASRRASFEVIKETQDLSVLVDRVFDCQDEKLTAAAQAELQRRMIVAFTTGIAGIQESVKSFSEMTEQQSARIEAAVNDFNKSSTRYTRVLLRFTVAQVACAILAIIIALKH